MQNKYQNDVTDYSNKPSQKFNKWTLRYYMAYLVKGVRTILIKPDSRVCFIS